VVLSGDRIQLLAIGDAETPDALAEVLASRRGHRRRGAVTLLADVDPVDLL
jgi:hypothetical protein